MTTRHRSAISTTFDMTSGIAPAPAFSRQTERRKATRRANREAGPEAEGRANREATPKAGAEAGPEATAKAGARAITIADARAESRARSKAGPKANPKGFAEATAKAAWKAVPRAISEAPWEAPGGRGSAWRAISDIRLQIEDLGRRPGRSKCNFRVALVPGSGTLFGLWEDARKPLKPVGFRPSFCAGSTNSSPRPANRTKPAPSPRCSLPPTTSTKPNSRRRWMSLGTAGTSGKV